MRVVCGIIFFFRLVSLVKLVENSNHENSFFFLQKVLCELLPRMLKNICEFLAHEVVVYHVIHCTPPHTASLAIMI